MAISARLRSPRRPAGRLAASAAAARSAAIRLRRSHPQAPVAPDPHQRPVRGDLVLARPARSSATSRVEGSSGIEAADEAVVHLHARGAVAVGQALGLLQGEHPVAVCPPGPHPEVASACSRSSSAPPSRQAMFVHTATT